MTTLQVHDLARLLPLTTGADGVIRVAGTRVTLDTIVAAFEEGATAEELAQQYPSLELGDVYAVLGFYLQQRERVDAYLHERQQTRAALQKENEKRFPRAGVRERLLTRRNAKP